MANTLGYTQKPNHPLFTSGVIERKVRASYSKAAADESGTVVIMARALPLDVIVTGIKVAITLGASSGTADIDIGLYRSDNGAVIDKDILTDGMIWHGGLAAGYDVLGLNVSNFDYEATLGDLLSKGTDQAYHGGVDICMTINTTGATAGVGHFDILLAFPA